ncbi:MAG: hypothetical protein IAB82_01340 [Bacteroidetes bacterium]|uniref:Transmembrane protein n=1 Tax=Candidatus Cryptobacteroides faecavium TaxID=2840762 RepID=A0A9D9IE10_9BACT|nr:hypothetical protein [Candidatus Cryptobacteroides faecavium]
MKDSEIRKFIHDNMPQIEGSGRFMDELVRQIDLLPVPASLDGRSEEEKQANIRMILDVARSIKRRYRRSAILFAVLSVVLLSCAVLAIFLIPELHEAVMKYYIYIAVAFAAIVLSISLSALSASRM